MTSKFHWLAMPCLSLLAAACGGRLTAGEFDGLDASNGGGGSGGTGGSRGASGSGGPITSPDVRSGRCASGSYWTGGNVASAVMSPGRPCMAGGCHSSSSRTPMTAGGTIYTTAGLRDDNDCNGDDGLGMAVALADDTGVELFPRIQVNAVGNFLTARALPASFRVKVIRQGREFPMISPVTDGNCNYCHTFEAFMGAKGRIVEDSNP